MKNRVILSILFCVQAILIYRIFSLSQIFFWRDGWTCENQRKPEIRLHTRQGESWIMTDMGTDRYFKLASNKVLETGDLFDLGTSNVIYEEGIWEQREAESVAGTAYLWNVSSDHVWLLLWAEAMMTKDGPSYRIFGFRSLPRNPDQLCDPHPEPPDKYAPYRLYSEDW